MRFSNTLRANQVDEWKEHYVEYDLLKPLIARDKRAFKARMDADLRNIDDFFFLLEKEAVVEKEEIFTDVGIALDDREVDGEQGARARSAKRKAGYLSDDHGAENDEHASRLRIRPGGEASLEEERDNEGSEEATSQGEDGHRLEYLTKKTRRGMREKGLRGMFKIPKQFERRKREKNIQEFLHAVISIKRFRELNYTGLMKLSKKYDKAYPQERFHEEFSKRVNESYFNRSRRIDDVYRSVKVLYKNVFARDDPDKAKTVFKKLKVRNKADPIVSYASGILGGVSLGMIGFIDFGERQMDRELFFAMALLQYGAFLFGVSLGIFKRFHINYKFIFHFDVCSSLSLDRYLFLTSLSIFAHVAGTWANIAFVRLNPYWLLLVQFSVLLMPFKVLYHESRFYLLVVIFRIIVFPMSFVRFRHFYFADVGQSLTFCFKRILFYGADLDWRVEGCANSFFGGIRFLQCLRRYRDTRLKFPHIANALKYTIAILAGVSVPLYASRKTVDLFVYKTMVVTISSIYSCAWDVFMDWGIVRDKMVYPRHTYAWGVVFNVACRFAWVVTDRLKVSAFWMAFLEITRRFMWTVFRVEFEHLNNCSEFKSKGSMRLTSRELFYKKDYEANTRPNDTETENDSSVA